MHKFRVVPLCIVLLLCLALLIPLIGCKGGETATPTPTGTTGATTTPTGTPTATKTPTATSTPTATKTPTSTSGETLSGIYGGGKNLGDVQFDMVTTSPKLPQAQTATYYYQNYPTNVWKSRMEMTTEGTTMVYLVLYGPQTMYMWTEGDNVVIKMDFGQAAKNPTEDSEAQITPTRIGPDTIDGHPCDGWQYTASDGTVVTLWIWTAKSFPVKMVSQEPDGTTTTVEYKKIVFGTIPDSKFELPAGAQVTQFPSLTP